MRRDEFDAAILDLDGTMVDTLGDFDAAVNAMLAELRLPAMPARRGGTASLAALAPDPRHAGARWRAGRPLRRGLGQPQRHFDLAVNGQHSQVFPGVREALARFAASGLALACVTNKPAAFTAGAASRTALAPYFSAVVLGGDSLPKPDPLPLLTGLRAARGERARAR